MELSGSRRIAADRRTVWAALNDPAVLKESVPGCQEMTGTPEDGLEATVKQKVGPVSATFRGTVRLSNVVPGESYTISGEGKGGAAGFAKGGADVRLEDAEGATLLSYDVRATVGGKLAQLGSRIIDGFAKKMADQFFENFQKAVEGPAATVAAEPASAPDQAAPTAAPPGAAAAAAAPAAPAAPVPEAPPAAGSAPPPGPTASRAEERSAAPSAGGAGQGALARALAWIRSLFGGR